MRRSTTFVVFITSFIGFVLFQLKYEVMKLESQYKNIHLSLKNSQEAISILNAEWSHLTSPERLQKLAVKHLDIIPVSGKQLVSWRHMAKDPPYEETAVIEDQFSLDQLVSTVLNDDSLGFTEGD